MSTNPQNLSDPFVASVKRLVREHGGVRRAWEFYRSEWEYFDGEVEIEASHKRSFFAAARVKKENQ